MDKLFINKPVSLGGIIVRISYYDYLHLEKVGYYKYFGEDCVKWFVIGMSEIETSLKNFFINDIELYP